MEYIFLKLISQVMAVNGRVKYGFWRKCSVYLVLSITMIIKAVRCIRNESINLPQVNQRSSEKQGFFSLMLTY